MKVKDKSEGIATVVDALGPRILGLRKSLGISQAEFAKKFDVSQVAVSRWEKNQDTPSPLALNRMAGLTEDESFKAYLSHISRASLLGEAISRSLHTSDDFRMVKLLRDPVAAGTPRATDETEIQARLPFPKDIFPPGGELYALKVVGDSMYPSVPDGYTVVVDTAQRDPKKLVERMVAAREGDGVTIKWLRKDGDTYLLVPQHTSTKYPVRIMRADGDFSIVGRVIYIMGAPPDVRK